MDMIEGVLKLFNAYPTWAKVLAVLGLLTTFCVLVFAPRNTPEAVVTPSGKAVYLRIRQVRLFPHDSDAEVQLLIHVNGTTYRHPSTAGVEWMKVGPGMSEKLIELPASEYYTINMELNRRGKPTLRGDEPVQYVEPSIRATSQLVSTVYELPYEEEYRLYDVNGETRSAGVSASVTYRISRGP
jgi:hypothetical protein